MSLPAPLLRRFEAVVFDWEATAAPDRSGDATHLRDLVEACCAEGLDLVVVSGTHLADVDGRLGARLRGPGTLHLALDHGREIHAADADGVHLVWRRTGDDRDAGIGPAGTSDAARSALTYLWRCGIGPSQVLICGDVASVDGGPPRFTEVLADQLLRRRERDPPSVADEPGWTLAMPAIDAQSERATEALMALGDGRTGTRGSVVVPVPESAPGVRVAGVYRGDGPETELLPGPLWNLVGSAAVPRGARRRLDLRTGTLWQAVAIDGGGALEAVAFASLAAPATMALRVRAPAAILGGGQGLHDPSSLRPAGTSASVSERPGSIAAATVEDRTTGADGAVRLQRLAGYAWQTNGDARPEPAQGRAGAAARLGYERLLREHRRAWASRWEVCDARIDGDDALQLGARLAIYHLIASTPSAGQGPVGARGLTGGAYRGHVFWDTESYVLPFHAATSPERARAILEYRVARLPAALAEAGVRGRAGARFPWESAESGREVTPTSAPLPTGEVVAIRTGELEDHIAADVAWAAACYAAWTNDARFVRGPGRELLVQTARYWASRVVVEGGRAHIHGVIGPDEYHEDVDDNAYTNVMARWNLRAAARVVDGSDTAPAHEAAHWRQIADALVDGYDAASGVYEQFAGFFDLEPLIIAEVADRRPVAAPLLLGAERVARSQVVKQADVLMLHYLLPDAVAAGSLIPNLDYYEPRTAHGSTLSPGVHAALLARAGRPEAALDWLRLAARIDLDDLSATTAGGVHLATMGAVWRALSWGFAGLAASGDGLVVDPRPLPASWRSLDVGVQYRGTPVRVRIDHDAIEVLPAAPVDLVLGPGGRRARVTPAGTRLAAPEPEARPT